jgi:SAM-dependent methyltransferase
MESEHRGRYLWAARLAKGLDVLDAGCGTGYGTEILAGAEAGRVVGMDISETAISQARSSSSHPASEFSLGSLHSLPFEDSSFDLAVCFEVIEHVEDQELAIAELRRVLRPNGVLAISSPNRDVYPPGNPYHTHEFVPEELERALAEEFANVRLFRQSPWLAAAILDDEQARGVGVENELRLRVVKIAAVGPDEEMYTVALASGGELPSAEAIAVLGEPFELDWWQDQLANAQADVQRLRNEMLEAAREAATLRQTTTEMTQSNAHSARRLLEVEEILAQSHAQLFSLEETNESLGRLVGELEERVQRADRVLMAMQRSFSWKVTAPLRAIKQRR